MTSKKTITEDKNKMPKSLNNNKITLIYKSENGVVKYTFRKSDWQSLERIYYLKNFTAEDLDAAMMKKGNFYSVSKYQITLKKFKKCGFIDDITDRMKKQYAPRFGVQQHKGIRYTNRSKKSKIIAGETGRTKYYDMTEKGATVFEKLQEVNKAQSKIYC